MTYVREKINLSLRRFIFSGQNPVGRENGPSYENIPSEKFIYFDIFVYGVVVAP
jgi:hypothetical protein